MTKKKKRQGPGNQSTTPPLVPPQGQISQPAHEASSISSPWATFRRLFWKGLELTAILGVIAFYYQFSPNLSVTPQSSFAGRDPFQIPFSISNNGYIDFHNVKSSCILNDIKHDKGMEIANVEIKTLEGQAKIVSAGEALTVRCELELLSNIAKTSNLASADIYMDISFEVFPYHLFRTEKKSFRFVAVKAPDDRWHWLPQPSLRH